MRKIVAGLFISLDGVIGDPQDWHFPYYDADMGAAVDGTLTNADTMLFGRVTYEGFAEAWPQREAAGGEEAAFAKKLGDVRKVVVSHGDVELTWRNSERLEGDLLDGVAKLKAEPGGDIAMSGSPSVVRQLLEAGLLDELHLLVHPVAVRDGLRLWDEGDAIPLRLLSSSTFETGVLHLVYGPDPDPPTGGYDEAVAALNDATT